MKFKVGTLTALALACAAAIILNAACKAGDRAGTESATVTNASNAPARGATPHPTSTPGDGVRRITVAETQQMVEKGTAVVVDVRPKTQYDQHRIKGSISIPRGELKGRAGELPKDKLVIFYCA